ncbi:MAG: porin [Dongiaceae bacterium]
MRGLLLGSTALAAAGLIAGPAIAADGVKLGIAGRYAAAFGGAIGEDSNAFGFEDAIRDYVAKQDVEIHFRGETTLANGLTVGARVELEGQTSSDQIDAVYVYFNGNFGEIRFGDTLEALASLCYTIPSASNMFGADSPLFNFSNAGVFGYSGTNGTCYGIDNKSTKLVYFSPDFAGFHFAASFTPDNTEDTRNTVDGAATRFSNDFGQLSENLSLAATFEHEFNGVALGLGGGASFSFDRENTSDFAADNRREYNSYARVGYEGFTIGGAWSLRSNTADFGDVDNQVFGAGATYGWSRYAIGFGWTRGLYERGFSGTDESTSTR